MTYVIYKDGRFWMFSKNLRGDSTRHAQIHMRAFGEFIERLNADGLYHDYALVRVDRVGGVVDRVGGVVDEHVNMNLDHAADTVTILATFYGTRVAAAN